MLSRALSLATVTLLVGYFAAGAAHAQLTNLEAGKTPSQIFSGTCNACHKSPRGLLKNVPASSLQGFLRQHYTTSGDMASVLASYLISNGASDTRYQGRDQPKTDQAKGARQEGARQEGARQEVARPEGKPEQLDRFGRRQNPAAPIQEVSRPDADGITPQAEGGRPGRDGKRRPGQPPDATKPADGQTPVQASTESKPGKQKSGKRGKPGAEEPSKSDEAAREEAFRRETMKIDAGKPDAGKTDGGKANAEKPEAAKSDPSKSDTRPDTGSDTAKVDPPKETGGSEPAPLRPDPVPLVTPAPSASAPSSATPEPADTLSAPAPALVMPVAPAVTASSPPVAPAGPPVPPISE